MFLISSYGTPLAQTASYFALHTSLFGPDGAVNYDYIVTNNINSLLIGSRCIPNGTHTLTIVEPIWPMLHNVSKTQGKSVTCSFNSTEQAKPSHRTDLIQTNTNILYIATYYSVPEQTD